MKIKGLACGNIDAPLKFKGFTDIFLKSLHPSLNKNYLHLGQEQSRWRIGTGQVECKSSSESRAGMEWEQIRSRVGTGQV